jgi:hypothetical protein
MDTDFDFRFFRSTWLDSPILSADCSVLKPKLDTSIYEVGLTAGVTGQQRMITPPKHLILPLHLLEVGVALH